MCIGWYHGWRGTAGHDVYVLAQKEVRFDQIGKDLIIQDSKRLRRRLPERLSCSG